MNVIESTDTFSTKMKHLKAKNNYDKEVIKLRLDEIYFKENGIDKKYINKINSYIAGEGDGSVNKIYHQIFPRHIELAYSIGKDGLLNPIVVKKENKKHYFTFGGNRLQCAFWIGYESIDVVVCDDDELQYLSNKAENEDSHIGKEIWHGGRLP
jgi:hypothetical protein